MSRIKRAVPNLLIFLAFLAPIVYMLAVNNWSVETIIYEQPYALIENVKEEIESSPSAVLLTNKNQILEFTANSLSVEAKFRVTNNFNAKLSVSGLYADIYCAEHEVFLGTLKLNEEGVIPPGLTTELPVVLDLSEGLSHLLSRHMSRGYISFDAALENLTYNVSIYGIDTKILSKKSVVIPILIEVGVAK